MQWRVTPLYADWPVSVTVLAVPGRSVPPCRAVWGRVHHAGRGLDLSQSVSLRVLLLLIEVVGDGSVGLQVEVAWVSVYKYELI